MNLDYFALLMGLMGSLHCAGMCGPILLSMPFMKEHFLNLLLKQMSYHFGRISVYVVLGASVFLVGSSFSIFLDQKMLSIILGSIMIVFSLLFWIGLKFKTWSVLQNSFILFISNKFGKFYHSKMFPLIAGVLNGLIPCGMVYVALGITMNLGDINSAIRFMFFFGIGTAPLLISMALGATFLKRYLKFNVKNMMPFVGMFMGILFVFRALEFNIPFLSPVVLKSIAAWCGID